MSQIDYSSLFRPKRAGAGGHSVENSFYLQKSVETAGRYKAYYKYNTAGAKRTVMGASGWRGK